MRIRQFVAIPVLIILALPHPGVAGTGTQLLDEPGVPENGDQQR